MLIETALCSPDAYSNMRVRVNILLQMSEIKLLKKPKQKKWNEDEVIALIEAVKPNYIKLFNNETSEAHKSEMWQQATNRVNSIRADVLRTAEKVKEKWGYLKSDAKKAYTLYNTKKRMTGGGPAPPSPAAKYKMIKDIVPCEIFEGIEGGCAR